MTSYSSPIVVLFEPMSSLNDIDDRARQVFRQLVETYIHTGEPVGSRTLSQDRSIDVSAATIRNVMADLTDMGLLHSPHVSAGRMPTELGMRLFVDGLLQIGDLSEGERTQIERELGDGPMDGVLQEAAARLTGLTQSASLVITEKSEMPLRHLEFVPTGSGEALAVLVFDDGSVENRIIKLPQGLPSSSLGTAGNYLNNRLRGRTLSEARSTILKELDENRATLDALTTALVRKGVAEFSGPKAGSTGSDQGDFSEKSLIVRGHSHLLDETSAEDLERVRMLFDDLESKKDLIELLGAARDGEGVRIFIGSENRLFSLSGSSVIVAPYRDSNRNIVGVLGVIGPTRLNYARVIPIVDYTAEVVTRLLK